jgi:hypothetical protein
MSDVVVKIAASRTRGRGRIRPSAKKGLMSAASLPDAKGSTGDKANL